MPQKRVNVSLDTGTLDLLDKVGENRRSAYLTVLVEDAWRRWQGGLNHLQAAGWSAAEVFAACDVLNGSQVLRQPLAQLAVGMRHVPHIAKTLAARSVSTTHWEKRCKQVASDPETARALQDVVAEFWRHNEACDHAIRRLDIISDPPRLDLETSP